MVAVREANVLVSKGQVISVDLIDGGSGYTTAPKVIATRRFDILTERDVGVSLINVGINPYIETLGMTAVSVISEIDESGLSSISGISSLTVRAVGDAEIQLEREFTPDEIEVFSIGGSLDPERDYVEVSSSRPTLLLMFKSLILNIMPLLFLLKYRILYLLILYLQLLELSHQQYS